MCVRRIHKVFFKVCDNRTNELCIKWRKYNENNKANLVYPKPVSYVFQ